MATPTHLLSREAIQLSPEPAASAWAQRVPDQRGASDLSPSIDALADDADAVAVGRFHRTKRTATSRISPASWMFMDVIEPLYGRFLALDAGGTDDARRASLDRRLLEIVTVLRPL